MKYFYLLLGMTVGFLVTLYGSVDITSAIQETIYGPYPFDGDVPVVRKITDLGFSFAFTVLGGYLAARIAPSHHVLAALIGGLAYFCLSAYWYSGYGLTLQQWIEASLTLIKVPVGAYLGGWLYQKYGRKVKADGVA